MIKIGHISSIKQEFTFFFLNTQSSRVRLHHIPFPSSLNNCVRFTFTIHKSITSPCIREIKHECFQSDWSLSLLVLLAFSTTFYKQQLSFFFFSFFFPQLVQEEKLKTINFLFSFIALGSKPHNLMSFIDVVLITCSSYYSYCCCLFWWTHINFFYKQYCVCIYNCKLT